MSPALRLCPRCGAPFPADLGARAKHLIDVHGVPAMVALAEARGPEEPSSPSTTKEIPMPTGVYPRASNPSKPCGRCKRPKTDHMETCPRRAGASVKAATPGKATGSPRGRRRTAAAVPVALATNGADPVATIRAALLQLEAELTSIRALKAAMAKALGA